YPSLSSLSICKLPFTATPSAPLLNPQVHERLPLRTVPHSWCMTVSHVRSLIPKLLNFAIFL
ncbi:hypothetical protein K443DRAFT_103244, partial [Laccaria amethystina LaAM-08-1]